MEDNVLFSESSIEIKKRKGSNGLLLIRFPDTRLKEFRNTVNRHTKSLQRNDGKLIALASQLLGTHDRWPPRTSLALFLFGTVDGAVDWFNNTPDVCEPGWLRTCDAMVVTTKEPYNPSHQYFRMVEWKMNTKITMTDVRRFNKDFTMRLRPLRLEKGGRVLTSTTKSLNLRGKWLEYPNGLTIMTWINLTSIFQYLFALKEGKSKPIYDEMTRMIYTNSTFIFQTQDLSPFRGSTISQPSWQPGGRPVDESESIVD